MGIIPYAWTEPVSETTKSVSGLRSFSRSGTDADKGTLEDAIKAFQEANGLEPSGEPNDELKEKLQSLHGR